MISFVYAKRLIFSVTLCALVSGPVLAREPRERSLNWQTDVFAGYVPTFQSGDALPKEGVFAITLRPVADVAYLSVRDGMPQVGYGGTVTLESVAPGRYGIVLSQEVWLEAVYHQSLPQHRLAQRKVSFGASRFAEIVLESGSVTLELQGANDSLIMIAMTRLPD